MRREILSIQVLRGLAALFVALFHLRGRIEETHPALFAALQSGGCGVDLFFVISGFIIVYINEPQHNTLSGAREFLINRFFRIAPLYYLCTLGSMGNSMETWLETLRSLAFLPLASGPAPTYGFARIITGWTLNYEMFFYLLTAAAMLFSRRVWHVLLFAMIALVTVPMLHFGFVGLGGAPGYAYSYAYLNLITNPMILEFGGGVVIGLIYKRHFQCIPTAVLLGLLGLGVWGVAAQMVKGGSPHGLLTWGLPFMCVVWAAAECERRLSWKPPAAAVYLGTISYSFYLLHMKCNGVLTKIIKHGLRHNAWNFGMTPFLVSLLFSLAVAAFSYHLIEQKLSRFLKVRFRSWVHGSVRNPVIGA